MAQGETAGGTFLTIIDATRRAERSAGRRGAPNYPQAGFEAQLLGQPYQRRGLKGGLPVLAAARGAYLSAEFAGDGDRRPTPGLVRTRAI